MPPRRSDTHRCPGGCGRHVDNHLFACPADWDRLPPELARPITDTHRTDRLGHAAAMVDARDWYLSAVLGVHLWPLRAALDDLTRRMQAVVVAEPPPPAWRAPIGGDGLWGRAFSAAETARAAIPMCTEHWIPGADRDRIAVPVLGCRACAEWNAGEPFDDTVERDRRAAVKHCAGVMNDGVNYSAEARDLARDIVEAFGEQYGITTAPNETGSPDAP